MHSDIILSMLWHVWYSVAVSLPCALRFGLHFSYDRNIVVDNILTKLYTP